MTFLETIFARLRVAAASPVLVEIHDGRNVSATGAELLALVATGARNSLSHGA